MNILILGAGAVGGYYGARLLDAGERVSFLVRPARAALLRENGLRIDSPVGNLHLHDLSLVTTEQLRPQYGLVILSCKAYDLHSSLDAIAPAIGPDTAIMPLLNGMAHLDAIEARFGRHTLVPGLCTIASTVDADGTIRHLYRGHGLSFGDIDGGISPRAQGIADSFARANFDTTLSDDIMPAMWAKWVQLATLAGSTTLMRASIGEILQGPGGRGFIEGMIDEALAVARGHGVEPPDFFLQRARKLLTEEGSVLTASMYRDICNGSRVEADHIIGDLIARGDAKGIACERLKLAYLHLKCYEIRRSAATKS